MPKLFYVMNMSLDGYIEDKEGAVDFFPVDDDVFIDQTRMLASTGTFLYGRRLYDTMAVWETDPALAQTSQMMADFADTWLYLPAQNSGWPSPMEEEAGSAWPRLAWSRGVAPQVPGCVRDMCPPRYPGTSQTRSG